MQYYLPQIGLIIAVLTAAAAADRYSTDQTKKKLSAWIGQAKTFDWHSYVAQRSWFIYTKVFGSHGTSKRFIITSLFAYLIICLVSFGFLAIAHPSTFHAITSVWVFGSSSEKTWWSLCMLFGGLLYVLANAQTLYFLEILKTAPNFFRFFLVAYADFLITASIALFGVPLLLATYTLGASYTGSSNLPLNIDFTRLHSSPSEDLANALEPGRTQQASSDEQNTSIYYVRFGYREPSHDTSETNADFDSAAAAAAQYPELGIQVRRGTIVYSSPTEFIGVVIRGLPYRDYVMALSDPQNPAAPLTHERFCRGFASGALNGAAGYTVSPPMRDVAVALLRACLTRGTVTVEIPASINVAQIRLGRLYRTYLLMTLDDFVRSISSGFRSYLTASPYALIRIEDPAQVWNQYAVFFRSVDSGRPFEEMVMKSYMREHGANRLVMNRSLAAGSINVAILSTALFNLVVMSIFFVVFPLIRVASRSDRLGRYITLRKTPFAILATLLVIWASVLWVVIGLIAWSQQ